MVCYRVVGKHYFAMPTLVRDTTYKNELKIDHNSKEKAETMKFLGESLGAFL